MIKFSIALEGDKNIEFYLKILKELEKSHFYSLQIYEHVPFKPAIPIVSILSRFSKKLKVGAVTVPFFLYHPFTLARYSSFLQEISSEKSILGISRGAYSRYLGKNVDRRLVRFLEFLDCLNSIFNSKSFKGEYYEYNLDEKMNISFNKLPEIYVGTSGPKLCEEAVKYPFVKGIIVDNLWNSEYARKMRNIIDYKIETIKRDENFELIARPFTYVDENLEMAIKNAERILEYYIDDLVGNSPMLKDINRNKLFVENFCCVGNVSKIEKEIEDMIKAGVNHICFGLPLGKNPIKVIKVLEERIVKNFYS
jgi:Coenzyme F420-dependent N5,N10-methylene tetrahydromethanopterin reductase and related flavin-dependent oxidoreductases